MMRRALFVLWAVVTALMGYSALTYKSVGIEADVDARTKAALRAAGLPAEVVSTDGRHVTLDGLIEVEAQRAAFLRAATPVTGALGPVDRLRVRQVHGFLTARRTETGIALVGSVPDAQAQARLTTAAQAAVPDGVVEDRLTVTGGTTALVDRIAPALPALGLMSHGQLSVTNEGSTMAGQAASPQVERSIEALLPTEAGWVGTIAPADRAPALRDQIEALEAQRADLTAAVTRAESARAETQTLAEQHTADLAQARTEAQRLGAEVARLRAEAAQVDTTARQDIAAQRNALRAQSVLQARSLGAARRTAAEAETRLETLRAERDALATQVATLQPQADLQARTLGAARIEAAQTQATLEDLRTQNTTLRTDRDEAVTTSERLRARATALDTLLGQTQNLAILARRDLRTAQSDLATAKAARDTARRALRTANRRATTRAETLATLRATLTEAQTRADQAQATLATLQTEHDQALADRDAAQASAALAADLQTRLAEMTRARNIAQNTIGIRDTQIAALNTTIADLRTREGSGAEAVRTRCNALAARVVETSQITFLSNSATLDQGSLPLLERLTGIALACITPGTSLEIGGHTDSRGAQDANQTLSEARAEAVRSFMVARGINAGRLAAIGYGETQPIADNATPEGQAANRRISFLWRGE